ncbi:uncharacterized protein KY384_008599 [Bacidia gigantensis]|uniref:uncharacterized protein n=1 Tax=Bacidia gigantensis TaxID=2732470 RepID=UPI001D03EF07|nr:uncharacterized protein KY384_008599 [Bacidia gigantensis]KAG8527169.1 hypothetical protein KY384_008599 [Bacidia gigantensis]
MFSSILQHIHTSVPCQPLSDLGIEKYFVVFANAQHEAFLEHYVTTGLSGGILAAKRLRSEALTYLRFEGKFDAAATVIIYVYTDLDEAARNYYQSGALDQPEYFSQFRQGFSHGLVNGQAILADLNSQTIIGQHNIRSEYSAHSAYYPDLHLTFVALLNTFVGDDRCLNVVVVGTPTKEYLQLIQWPRYKPGMRNKFLQASFPTVFEGSISPTNLIPFPSLQRSMWSPIAPQGILTQPRAFPTGPWNDDMKPLGKASRARVWPSLSLPDISLFKPYFERMKSTSLPDTPLMCNLLEDRDYKEVHSAPAALSPPGEIVSASQDEPCGSKLPYRSNRQLNAEAAKDTRNQFNQMPLFNHAAGSCQNLQGQKATAGQAPRPIIRDEHGRRLDIPTNYKEELINQLDNGRLCNNYHLKGNCAYPKCKHLHQVPVIEGNPHGPKRNLTSDEVETLRYIARRSPCRNRTSCNDPRCFASHRCPNHVEKGRKTCGFPVDMHFEISAESLARLEAARAL